MFLIGVLITIQEGEAILQEINLYPNWIVNDHKYDCSLPWKQIVVDKGKIYAEDLQVGSLNVAKLWEAPRSRAWVTQDKGPRAQEAAAKWKIVTSQPAHSTQPPPSHVGSARRTQTPRPVAMKHHAASPGGLSLPAGLCSRIER